MNETIRRVLQSTELMQKIQFTLLMILVYRLGGFIPVPGIDGEIALSYFRHATGGGQNLFQLIDIFSGGAFSQMTIFALGVVPYISASIIFQLLVALIPSLQREVRENPEYGRRKLTRWTRIGTLFLAFVQSTLFARFAIQMNQSSPGIISSDLLGVRLFDMPWLFYLIMITTMTTGTCFLMWIGEQITEKGIGNGMSLIIAVGILSQLPSTIGLIVQQLNLDSPGPGQLSLFSVVVLMALFIGVTVDEAKTLVLQLNSGSLDVPLTPIQQTDVDATLGADSLHKSLTAGLIGIACVAFFMIVYYRLPGLVATVALGIYAAILLAIFKIFNITLTLPGIAGFVISTGMAVDANVLIFERMKEEMKRGLTMKMALQEGFHRAWPSIRDSNISTFITCIILYWFGNTFGAFMVKGFALTLFLGVAVSLFSAITVTRTLLIQLVNNGMMKTLTLYGVKHD